jgi:hypothetical protein
VGKGNGEREGEAAPVTPPVRQDRRPFTSAESCTNHRGEKGTILVGGEAGTKQGPERHREHLRRATV